MNANVHFPVPSFNGQPGQPQPRREDIIRQPPQLPPSGLFYQPQPYLQVQPFPRPNYPALNGPYSPLGSQQPEVYAPELNTAETQQRVPTEPEQPFIIQQGTVYKPDSSHSSVIQYPTFDNYPQNHDYTQIPSNNNSFYSNPYGYQGNQTLIPIANNLPQVNPNIHVHQLETRIKSTCCYNVLLYLGLAGWIFSVYMTFAGHAKPIFKVLEIVLSLVFLTGFVLAIKAKSSLDAKKQFRVFVIFTVMIFAQLAVSILSVISMNKRMGKHHGYGRYLAEDSDNSDSNGYRHHDRQWGNHGHGHGRHGQGHHGQGHHGQGHHGQGHHGEGHHRSQFGNGGYERSNNGYNGYNGFDNEHFGHYRNGLKACMIIFMVVLPFIFNVLLSCYARSLCRLMKERAHLLGNFRPINRSM